MYRVAFWSSSVELEKLNIVKVTEKTVLTSNGFRYHKRCQSYELYDSFNIALICAKNRTKRNVESLENRLEKANEELKKFTNLKESDLK